MQTEWSSGRDDRQRNGLTSTPAPVGPLVEDAAPPFDPAPDGPASDDTVTAVSSGVDGGMADEEGAHRSEVDAVDQLLDEVELAMARLDDGTYGRCEMCGVQIDDVELAAEPLVRECPSCSTGTLAFGDA